MNLPKWAVFAVVAASVGWPAAAQTWQRYARTSAGTVLYLDADSVRRSGDIAHVWVRQDHSLDRTVSHRETKVLWALNCVDQTQALISYVDYGANGTVTRSYTNRSYEIRYDPIVPGSLGHTLFEQVCAAG